MTDISDLDAERALVGAALLEPSVVDVVNLDVHAFVHPEQRQLWATICELRSEGKPLDPIVVADRAQVSYSEVANGLVMTVTAQNAEYYAEIIREHALTRRVLGSIADIAELHRRGRASGSALLDAALGAITQLDVGTPTDSLTIGEVLKRRFQELDAIAEARARGESVIPGIPTGMEALDNMLGGLPRGEVTILAGRPAMGKSAFGLACADGASARGHGVHIFSLEDPMSAYADRAMARASKVPATTIRACNLNRDEITRISYNVRDLLQRRNWLYEDVSDVSAEEIVRTVRRRRADNRTELVIVDYLQILRRPTRYESVHDAVSQNLLTLARAAKRDGIAYLVVSQLSRKVETREDKRPFMSDVRDSGTIEERSKCILGLYRGAYYGAPKSGTDYDPSKEGPPTDEEWEKRIDVLILKYNYGESGFVRLTWDGPTLRIE